MNSRFLEQIVTFEILIASINEVDSKAILEDIMTVIKKHQLNANGDVCYICGAGSLTSRKV